MDIWNFFFRHIVKDYFEGLLRLRYIMKPLFYSLLPCHTTRTLRKCTLKRPCLESTLGQMINSQLIASCRHVTSYNIEK